MALLARKKPQKPTYLKPGGALNTAVPQAQMDQNYRGWAAGAPSRRPGGPNTPIQRQPVQSPPQQPGASPIVVQQPATPPPLSSQGQTLRENANLDLNNANTAFRDSVFRAAMGLGNQDILNQLRNDPRFAGYDTSRQDPNSLWAQLGRQEQEGLQNVDYNSNDAGTFFSGFRLKNRDLLSQGYNRQRQQAVTDYQDQITQYARALAEADAAHRASLAEADQSDIDAATAIDPEDRTLGPPPSPSNVTPVGQQNQAKYRAEQEKQRQKAARDEAEAKAKAKAKKKGKKK